MSSLLFRGRSRNDPRVAITPRQSCISPAPLPQLCRSDIFKADNWTGGQRKTLRLAAHYRCLCGY